MIKATISHKAFKFPVGEMQVTVDADVCPAWVLQSPWVDVEFVFEKIDDIFELMLVCDALKRNGRSLSTLNIPYVPFGRQDRCNAPGESFSLKVFCDLINTLGFKTVVIDDPHSDVTPALLNNCKVRNQWELLEGLIAGHVENRPFYLVAPDAGALKKTNKLAQAIMTRIEKNKPFPYTQFLGVIEAGKKRDTRTGEITGTVVHAVELEKSKTFGDLDEPIIYVMVDDICDGGRTFIELAKELRLKGASKVHLYVTHGFFTKGLSVFDGIIDVVEAVHFAPGVR